jgi:dihydropteroate synthase
MNKPAHLIWSVRGRALDLSTRGLVMGIVNVTPDSFSDGGRFLDPDAAVDRGLALVAEGADILDVGGESTRPGAQPVGVEEELRRVLPVLSALRQRTEALLSIDTFKPEVAGAALEAGADIINDVTGLRDPRMVELAAGCDAGLVVMHMKGEPQTMQRNPVYADVVMEVREFFTERLRSLGDAGIEPERVVFDPGFGFGKTLEHNLALMRALPWLPAGGRPLLAGVSRKSMIARVLGSDAMECRFWPTVALTSWAREHGASLVRVHDVRANAQALRMTEAILRGG